MTPLVVLVSLCVVVTGVDVLRAVDDVDSAPIIYLLRDTPCAILHYWLPNPIIREMWDYHLHHQRYHSMHTIYPPISPILCPMLHTHCVYPS